MTLVAMTVMPGPQLVSAVPLSRRHQGALPRCHDRLGRLLPDALPASRSCGRHTSTSSSAARESRPSSELLEVLAGRAMHPTSRRASAGRKGGEPRLEPGALLARTGRLPDASLRQDRRRHLSPPDVPRTPQRRLPGFDRLPVHVQLLRRHRGVREPGEVREPVADRGEPRFLVREHGMDAIHFYDNNFFLKEDACRGAVRADRRRLASGGGARRGST